MHDLDPVVETGHLTQRQINLFGASFALLPPQARHFALRDLAVSDAIQPTTAFVENVRHRRNHSNRGAR